MIIQESVATEEGPFREAVRKDPGSAQGHYNLGTILSQLGKIEEAEASLREAIRLDPDLGDARLNLAALLCRLDRDEEAIEHARAAVRLDPESAEAHLNLGSALAAIGDRDESESSYHRALSIRPDWGAVHQNLGALAIRQGRPDQAIVHYERALNQRSDDPEVHKGLGIARLMLGDYERAWPEYEWRWKTAKFPPPKFVSPRWDGTPLEGRTILLTVEQGIGDILQFVRYVPLVRDRGGRVILSCPAALKRLLASCPGIDRLVVEGEALPPFDAHASLMSLPGILGTTRETIPADIPYLTADPSLVAFWGRELSRREDASFKVGIAWQGNARTRSVLLSCFAPVAQIPSVQLYSLQKGRGSEQIEALRDPFPIVDLGPRLDERSGPFMDTAAVMTHLDLIITVDTALAHLAGALGVSVWMALSFAPDWRWMLRGEDTPWYPSMRLFRQEVLNDWSGVFQRIAAALRQRIGAPDDSGVRADQGRDRRG